MRRTSTSSTGSSRRSADPIARNIEAMAEVAKRSARNRSALAVLCDRITQWAGTTSSLVAHAVWFSLWIAANTLSSTPLDPWPFPLLTAIVSFEAIFLTLFVLTSQNRLTHDADQRAHLALQVNLLAEQEMTLVLEMLRDLCQRSQIPVPKGLTEVLRDVDIQQVAATVARELSDEHKEPPSTD